MEKVASTQIGKAAYPANPGYLVNTTKKNNRGNVRVVNPLVTVTLSRCKQSLKDSRDWNRN